MSNMKYQVKSLINLIQLRRLSFGELRSWYSGLVKLPPPIPPYSHVIQIGDPCLRVVSDAVPVDSIKSSEIQFLIQRLRAVFNKYNCVGLSAPQIGIALRVSMIEFNRKHAKFYTNDEIKNKEITLFPQTVKYLPGLIEVIINPEIKVVDYTKVVHSEACESIKGFWADVPRHHTIEVKGYNENGDKISFIEKGWLARIFQHELDHLNGTLYTDVMNRKTLTSCCWQVVNDQRGKVELPFNR